jgi:putative nucleotidyltransferase with HDIG domain
VPPKEPALDSYTLKHHVLHAINGADYKAPVLPDAVSKLMSMASAPSVSFQQVETVIASDPSFAAKIVGKANSAYYSRGTPIDSLSTAIARLGLNELRDLAMQTAVNAKVFNVPEYTDWMVRERRHAFGTALLCKEICRLVGANKDLAFLCGLLHDLGKPISLELTVEWAKKNKKPLPIEAELQPLLDQIHPAVGAKVTRLWQLPNDIVEAGEFHHAPINKEKLVRMAAVVYVADVSCQIGGIGRPKAEVDLAEDEIVNELRMGPNQIKELLTDVERIAMLVGEQEGSK